MNAKDPLPLNEPQQRRLMVTLAGLEKHPAKLRARLEHGPTDLRFTYYEDAISASEAPSLLSALRAAEAQWRKMADELRLPAQTEPVRRAVAVGLELASINLYECRPDKGLAGYGKVAPATAEYLDSEIPKLDAALQSLLTLLQLVPGRQHSQE